MKLFVLIFSLLAGGCSQNSIHSNTTEDMSELNHHNTALLETATFGSGCFWCTEAVFQRVQGVHSVVSGYSGGKISNPTYREVTSGMTGHAEVIQIRFNPEEVSYLQLLEIFFKTHDPTTLNRQGADVGTQYRSVIFYHSQQQKELAEKAKEALDKEKIWNDPIVTEITEFKAFYKAEDYHQNYFANNPNQAYCQFVIVPKLKKMEKLFQDMLK
ncbi:MAG: peptide-methionine (S)-S-oxide reductase MsrA [Bacteroidales bacterium]|nr:peptide-methionine (S)-S-oxide reductase MsrA [Bacteroidales bacterium]